MGDPQAWGNLRTSVLDHLTKLALSDRPGNRPLGTIGDGSAYNDCVRREILRSTNGSKDRSLDSPHEGRPPADASNQPDGPIGEPFSHSAKLSVQS